MESSFDQEQGGGAESRADAGWTSVSNPNRIRL